MKMKMLYIALLIVSILAIIGLTSSLSTTKKHLADAEQLIEIQHELIEKLGAMDAINATINVTVNNKATFGTVKAGDVEVVADQVLRYTRRELLQTDTLCTN
jgi:Cu/Ag efflux protein CusF